MTALAANKRRNRRHVGRNGTPRQVATNSVVYQGSFLSYVESTGRVEAGDNAIGLTFLGVCDSTTKTGDTAGTVYAKYSFGHEELCTLSTVVTKAYEGCTLALVDDDKLTTLSNAGSAAIQVVVGTLREWVSSGSGWVEIGYFGNKTAP